MRYSKEHKQETHERIVKRAAVRLREKGAHGIGVADLMKEAGLTHGGFYRHFDSKEEMVSEAIAKSRKDFVAGTLDAASQGAEAPTDTTQKLARFIRETAGPDLSQVWANVREVGQAHVSVGLADPTAGGGPGQAGAPAGRPGCRASRRPRCRRAWRR